MKWIWPDGTVTGGHDLHFCAPCGTEREFDHLGCVKCGCQKGVTLEEYEAAKRQELIE
jgi:uncharacterized membrane protein YvbJ